MAATVASLRRRRAVVQSTRAPPEGWGRLPGAEAEVEAEAIGPWMGTHGGFCRRCRRLPAIVASAPHGPPLLPALVVPLLRPLAPLLPEQALVAACEAPCGAADEPGAASAPRNRMEATVWLEDEGGARAAQDQAGSLRCTPSWRAESARDASCRSCPIQRLFFLL